MLSFLRGRPLTLGDAVGFWGLSPSLPADAALARIHGVGDILLRTMDSFGSDGEADPSAPPLPTMSMCYGLLNLHRLALDKFSSEIVGAPTRHNAARRSTRRTRGNSDARAGTHPSQTEMLAAFVEASGGGRGQPGRYGVRGAGWYIPYREGQPTVRIDGVVPGYQEWGFNGPIRKVVMADCGTHGRFYAPEYFDSAWPVALCPQCGTPHIARISTRTEMPKALKVPAVRPVSAESSAGPRIVRLVKIVDTRERECVGGTFRDVFAPIPGSGISNVCYRCGKDHEVHAYVKLEDGAEVVVGTGCARREALLAGDEGLARIISSAERKAKSVNALRAEIERLEPVVKAGEVATRAVNAMAPPPVEFVYRGQAAPYKEAPGELYDEFDVVCGDATAHPRVPYREPVSARHDTRRDKVENWLYHREREKRDAVSEWRDRRLAERGVSRSAYDDAARGLEEARAKLKKLLASAR